jgi:TATA-box binding protein (TBP) (component of TFIID and TFIIIB)
MFIAVSAAAENYVNIKQVQVFCSSAALYHTCAHLWHPSWRGLLSGQALHFVQTMKQKRGPPWEAALEQACAGAIPLKRLKGAAPNVNPSAPVIINMVSTVSLLPQTPDRRYRLPLETINMALGPCSQYSPNNFAANILKIVNSTTHSTALVFGSGRVVLVSALTTNHTRYVCQLLRVIIEQIQCVMTDDQGARRVGTLSGRTVFEQNVIHNIVGHGDLGARINLQALRDANPESVKWMPDSFPAAKCSIWLTEDCRCHCGKRQAIKDEVDAVLKRVVVVQRKCQCVMKTLVFDTGRIVMTGGRSVSDVNAVFFRMKALVPQFRSETVYVPREDRFYQRLGAMMVGGSTGTTAANAPKVRARKELTQNEAVALALADARAPGARAQPTSLGGGGVAAEPPLAQMARAGRLEMVRQTLQMMPPGDPDVHAALERLPSDADPAMVALLRAHT